MPSGRMDFGLYQALEISGDMEKIHVLRISHSAVPDAATPGDI
jgi:hypothetical protein